MKTSKIRMAAAFLLLLLATGIKAQQKWTYEIGLDFPIVGLPGQNSGNYFKQIGFNAGGYRNLNEKGTLVAGLSLGGFHIRNHGVTWSGSLQAGYRPVIGPVELGFHLGVGYQIAYAPKGQYEYLDGEWQYAGHSGKSMLFVPVGLRLGYRAIQLGNLEMLPFLEYRLQAAVGYAPAVPILPVSFLSIGQQFKF